MLLTDVIPGLGSKKTHAQRFCVIGKNVDQRLEQLGAHRLWPRVDGDDSDSIEVGVRI